MAPSPSIHQPTGFFHPQDFRRFSDDRLQGTSFFGNNRNHWKVRNHITFLPRVATCFSWQKDDSHVFCCLYVLYCNLVLEIFRSPLFNDFLGKGKATSKSPLWHENYPFCGGMVNGGNNPNSKKKSTKRWQPKQEVLGVGNPTTLPLLFS